MSQLKVKQPVIHIPSFKEYEMTLQELVARYLDAGMQIPFPPSDGKYYYTDRKGWAALIAHLAIKSDFYKPDRFDCEDYALKAMITCAELFGLNTFRYVYGNTPWGAHGFNCAWASDGFLVFEPNGGFQGQLDSLLFDLGMNNYKPTHVLL